MNVNTLRIFRAVRAFVVMSVLLGVIYTLVVTGLGQVLFNYQANGSLIVRDGKVVGSELLSQPQTDAKYLHGRIEAKDEETFKGYYWAGPTNLTPVSKEFKENLQKRAQETGISTPNVDLVTGSGSGLDPHISKGSALAQVPRIANARNLAEAKVKQIIESHSSWNFGVPITNVLLVNLDLDQAQKAK